MSQKNEKREKDLDRELRDHLELDAEARRDRGFSADEARFAARRDFGNATRVKEVTREMWGWASLERFWQDVTYGLRLMRRNPGFTAVAILTLALGIGANTAIFSIINAVFLRPIPLRDADRIYVVARTGNQLGGLSISLPIYITWRDHRDAFEAFGLMGYGGHVTITGKGDAERILSLGATDEFFSLIGVQPALGRAFSHEECLPNGAKVAILSDSLWRRKFSADPNVIGQSVTIAGVPRVIVGVLPANFDFAFFAGRGAQIWLPFAVPVSSENPGNGGMICLGKLRKGATPAQAEAVLTPSLVALHDRFPRMISTSEKAHLLPTRQFVSHIAGNGPLLLFGAVGFVLLIACANVANLFLARSKARQREIAVRVALGASRGRLLRQMLTESVLFALFAGVAGILVCYATFKSMLSLVPADLQHVGEYKLDNNVFIFALLLSLATGIVFGLVPALEASRANPQHALKEMPSGAGAGRRQWNLRSVLVTAEVAISFVLLVGAALTLESFAKLLRVEPGFETHNTMEFSLEIPGSRAKTVAEAITLFDQYAARLSALPGVEAVAHTSAVPLQGDSDLLYSVVGRDSASGMDSHDAKDDIIGPNYFETLRIPLIRGRLFTEADAMAAEPVAIISRAMADEVWPNQDPIGQHIWIGRPMGSENAERAPRRIIGIVEDVREYSLSTPPSATMYIPAAQCTWDDARGASFIIRAAQVPMSLTPAIRSVLSQLAPDLPPSRFSSMQEIISLSLTGQRFSTTLLALFGAIALLIATVGVFGVISYAVAQRTREFGIRVALGASRTTLLRMVLGQGLRLAFVGVAVGLAASYWLTRLLRDLLFGVRPTDPVTFIGVSVVLLGVALAACWIPARRATRVDPIVALRYE